jgi:hypothetical protein
VIEVKIPDAAVPGEMSALLAALQFNGPSADRLCRLAHEQWSSLLRFCDLAHLTLPLAQLRVSGLPEWVSTRLNQNIADNTQRFERVRSTYLEAADALHRAGVEHLVLKGFTQTPDYVASPFVRQQSDLDFYCPTDQIMRAQLALQGIGYRSDTQLNYEAADHEPTMLRLGDWEWRGNAFDPEMPLSIELHFCFWNRGYSLLEIPDVEGFWRRRTVRRIEGMNVSAMTAVDQLGHISLHILRNLLMRDTIIHHVYELAYFLHKSSRDESFWREWASTQSAAMRAKQAIIFSLAQRWFRCNVHELAAKEIESLPAIQSAWLRYFGDTAYDGMFIERKDAVWLHLTLLSHWRERFVLLRRTFFPNRIPRPDLPSAVLSQRTEAIGKGIWSVGFVVYIVRRCASYLGATLKTLRRGASWVVYQYQQSGS